MRQTATVGGVPPQAWQGAMSVRQDKACPLKKRRHLVNPLQNENIHLEKPEVDPLCRWEDPGIGKCSNVFCRLTSILSVREGLSRVREYENFACVVIRFNITNSF